MPVWSGAPWLWLVRPDGWTEELESLAEAADAAAQEVQAEREERSALRRLAAAEAAAARAEAELARLQEVNAGLLAEVAAERQSRRRSEMDRDDIEAARRSAEAQLASLTETVDQMRARISVLAEAVDEDRPPARRRASRAGRGAGRGRIAALAAGRGRGRGGAGRSRARGRSGPVSEQAVVAGAAGARQLGESLAEVARLLSPDRGEPEEPLRRRRPGCRTAAYPRAIDGTRSGPGGARTAPAGRSPSGVIPFPFRPPCSTTRSRPANIWSGSGGCN